MTKLNSITEQIRNLQIGDSLTIKVSPLKKINSIRTIVSRLNKFEPELGKVFRSTTDLERGEITIKCGEA